jgi:hypothetical protein
MILLQKYNERGLFILKLFCSGIKDAIFKEEGETLL